MFFIILIEEKPKENEEEEAGEWIPVTKKSKTGLPTQSGKDTGSSKKIDDDYLDQF